MKIVVGWKDPELALRAQRNNFGVPSQHIPARPFMNNAQAEIEKIVPEMVAENIEKLVKGEMSEVEFARKVGRKAVAEVRKAIRNMKEPANAESTILQKGSDHPLIDTGAMIQGIGYQIKK